MLWAAIGIEIAYIGFFVLMTDGLTLGQRSPQFMLIAVVAFLAVFAAIVLAQTWLGKPASRAFPDEREEAVDTRAEQISARLLEGGVFAVIALAIFEASTGPNSLGSYSLTRPEGLVFAMVTISGFAGVARMLLAASKDYRL